MGFHSGPQASGTTKIEYTRRCIEVILDFFFLTASHEISDRIDDENVVRSYLEAAHHVIQNCHENQKEWFVAEPSFVPAIGKYLKGNDAAMRRDCSSIIQLLSTGSASRSGRIMNEGIGEYLSWVAM